VRRLSAVFHRTVKALLERFSKYIAGDTSAIPADLLGVTFRTVGGLILTPVSDENAEELTALGRQAYRCPGIRRGTKALREPPDTLDQSRGHVRILFYPRRRTAADKTESFSRGLTDAVDPALQERTFNLILSSVRNQDLISFFRGFAINPKAINAMRDFFESNYNSVGVPFFPLGTSLRPIND